MLTHARLLACLPVAIHRSVGGSPSQLPVDPDYTSRFYVRLRIRDQLGVIRVVGELAEKHAVSIHAILQVGEQPARLCLGVSRWVDVIG